NPKNITLVVGDSQKIGVTGGDGNYSFISSDEDIAIVGSTGNVIGLKAGISVVTVSDGLGNKESILVTVIRPETTATTTMRVTTTTRVTYAELVVSPKEILIDVNEEAKITVSGGDGNYTFISNDENIAEVGQNGLVTGLKPGETVIKVRDGEGNLATVKVTVKQPATTTVTTRATTTITTTTPIILTDTTETTRQTNAPLKASPDEITINEGERATITVTGGDGDYKFVVSDEDYAIVSSYGTVMGLKPGTAIVTVIDGEGNTDTVYVYVTALIYTTTETTYRTTARTTTRTTYRTWSTDPWEETTYPQASEEVSRETEASWEATTDSWATEPSTILGDVNDDYKVDSKDAVLVLKYYAAELVNADLTVAIIPSAADVNDDGKINSKDAISILRYYANSLSGINVGGMREFVSSDIPETTEYVVPETTNESDVDHNYKRMEINVGTVTVKPGTKTVNVPVILSGNKGFAGGGFIFDFDLNLSFDGAEGGIISTLATSVNNNLLSVTFAGYQNITSNGVMFTLQFELPDVIKVGDVYSITGSLDTFCDEYRYDLPVKIVDGAIKVDDEEYETTEPAITARPVYSTTNTTRITTAVSYESGISTTKSNPEFVIGNISAKPGYGYGEDSTEYSTDENGYSLSVPLKINKDCGIAGISAKINVDDNFKKVFQLESISLYGDGYSGPYSGTFIKNLDKWEFALSNTSSGNWSVQPDGTPILWYNIKITKDESVIASAAENLGIDLAKDSKGTYYKFPLEWSDYKVVDTYGTKINSKFKDGCIKVYVGGESETTSATDPWAETTYTTTTTKKVLTTAASTTASTAAEPLKADVNNVELEVGKTFKIKANQENLTYETSNSNIAVVSKSGEITAISAGTAIITVINSDKDAVSITVTVKNPVTTTSATTKPPVTTTTKPNIMLGDVNIDGEIDSKDAVLVLKDYAQVLTGSKSSIAPERGDINGDNSIDSKDAVKILKYYANKMVGNTVDIRNV
ncbi:MAG: Ig-like domain-containing protein, partial [Ruminococcus callidus]|nr:Ig-like domain-containing protein [Ruminococcus callidus]